jgi:hypothetical protein
MLLALICGLTGGRHAQLATITDHALTNGVVVTAPNGHFPQAVHQAAVWRMHIRSRAGAWSRQLSHIR